MPKMRIVENQIKYELIDEKTGRVLYSDYETREPEPCEVMDLEYKIHRKVQLGNKTVNIRAQSEQEYAEQLAMKAVEVEKEEAEKRERETKHNFKVYALQWYNVFSKPNISEVCQITYERQLNKYIFPVLGDLYIEDITPEDIQKMLNNMGDVAKATRDKTCMVLNQILKHALEKEIIRWNPLKSNSVKITGKESKAREAYSVEQMMFISDHIIDIKKDLDRAYIVISAFHTIRPEEVLGLRWEDIDFAEELVHIRRAVTHPDRNMPIIKDTKTGGSVRDMDMSLVAQIILKPMAKKEGFVFGGDKPLSYQQVKKICERVKKDIGAEFAITPARFRPTVISDLYHETGDAKYVQEQAGHANFDVTLKHYVSTRRTRQSGISKVDVLYAQKFLTSQQAES